MVQNTRSLVRSFLLPPLPLQAFQKLHNLYFDRPFFYPGGKPRTTSRAVFGENSVSCTGLASTKTPGTYLVVDRSPQIIAHRAHFQRIFIHFNDTRKFNFNEQYTHLRSSIALRSVRFGVRSRKLNNIGQSWDG
jgi:hypothetical protein